MNQYMQAVGFGQFPREKWNRLFEEVRKNPDVCNTYEKNKEEDFFEMTKNIDKGIGITWSGIIRDGLPGMLSCSIWRELFSKGICKCGRTCGW